MGKYSIVFAVWSFFCMGSDHQTSPSAGNVQVTTNITVTTPPNSTVVKHIRHSGFAQPQKHPSVIEAHEKAMIQQREDDFVTCCCFFKIKKLK